MKKPKKANVDHIAHQVNVTGVGAHRNKRKYSRKGKQNAKNKQEWKNG